MSNSLGKVAAVLHTESTDKDKDNDNNIPSPVVKDCSTGMLTVAGSE